ncbi:MAG TPA: hypothetical protein VFN30_04635 [Chitinophagaceae bacterium]|nr:hypothetical protein [Chitinophagaceae bacterium]
MKNIIFFYIIMFFIACNNSSDKRADEEMAKDTFAFGESPMDTLIFWNVNEEAGTRKKVLTEPIEHPNVQAIINGLNMLYPDVILQYGNITNDTLNLTIPQSETLTYKMGSAGASQYFATACINLFEIPSINYIHFDFTEGDHAKPGTFNRNQFTDIKEMK